MRIALMGAARTGKDTVGNILVTEFDMKRYCFGDIIKRQLDPVIREHFGFSAFTEKDSEKSIIRNVLTDWGHANLDRIGDEFFTILPKNAVNTRIYRPEECRKWKGNGGLIVWVRRPGYGPVNQDEATQIAGCREMVDHQIVNDGTLDDLHKKVIDLMAQIGSHARE